MNARRVLTWVAAASLALLLAVTGALASDGTDESKKKKSEPPKDEAGPSAVEATRSRDAAVKVYTNADLKRMFGGGPAEPAPAKTDASRASASPDKSPAGDWDPLAAQQAQKDAAAERRKATADAEQAVIAAEARVRAVEDRMRKIRNPYLGAPKAPEGDEEWSTLSAAERVKRSDEALAEARAALEAARAELARLR